jgi:hypothetical protein
VAALTFICSGQLLGYHAFYSMSSLDILLLGLLNQAKHFE